ncbi:aminoglycoside phosphotransferase family protein [soil metagenome]
MRHELVTVPESFRVFGRWQREGEAGRRWLAALPHVAADYCERWGLRVDGKPMHGGNGLAIPVRRDYEPLVLKLDWPDQIVVEQARALDVWRGRGTVLLIDSDRTAGVLLLERIDASRSLRDLPLDEAVPLVGQMLRRLAIQAPDGFRSTWDEALDYRASFRRRWEEAGQPFDARILDVAHGLAEEAASDRPVVMVNRDLHYDHVLRGTREPWLVVDPMAMVGSIEYQTGQLLWSRYDELAATGRLRWCLDALVDSAALEPGRAYAWAVLRCVDYWLWGLDAGFTEDPVRCRLILEELV